MTTNEAWCPAARGGARRGWRWCALVVVAALAGCSGDDATATDDDDGGSSGASTGSSGAGVGSGGGADEPAALAGITAAHNAARDAVGVAPLTWSAELAQIAQAWASQCVDVESPAGLVDHNDGRSDGFGSYVGENIYGSSAERSGPDAVASWVAEEADYDYASNSCSGVCGHYTQVVWADTQQVGCAAVTCPSLQFGWTVVCNYSPGGNDGGRPY